LFSFFEDQVATPDENLPDRDGKRTGDSYDVEEVTQAMLDRQKLIYEAGVSNGG